MFIMRLAEAIISPQWFEMPTIISLWILGVVVALFGGFMAFVTRPGIGIILVAIGSAIFILATVWYNYALAGLWWLILSAAIAALGVIIELMSDGPFGVNFAIVRGRIQVWR